MTIVPVCKDGFPVSCPLSYVKTGQRVPFMLPQPDGGMREVFLNVMHVHNLSPALYEILHEVNYMSSKEVVFLDSTPLMGGDQPYAVNWVDSASIPHLIPIFLNPRFATQEIVAHEAGHPWLEMALGYEDHRQYFDACDRARSLLVGAIQSAVLDSKITWLLRQRGGFDMQVFRRHLVAGVVEGVFPYAQGKAHGSRYGQLITASVLAVGTALPDLYDLTSEDRLLISQAWAILDVEEAALARVARQFVAAFGEHGYASIEEAIRTIDRCLLAAFEYLEEDFSLSRDLISTKMESVEFDKFPDFLPGAAVGIKHGILRSAIVRRQIIAEAGMISTRKAFVRFFPQECGFSVNVLPKKASLEDSLARARLLGKPEYCVA